VPFLMGMSSEFHDLWHSLKVPNDVDLLKQLASGASDLYHALSDSLSDFVALPRFYLEGLQATTGETPVPKAPTTKKKGKRSGPRQRQVRITNTHLKGEIDLSRNYAADRAL
jgi:transcription initiation factor TFIIE subunit beta